MDAVFRTDVGKVRRHNEDDGNFLKDDFSQLLVFVADGMGGHQAGDVASSMTKDLLIQKWQENDKLLNPKEAARWLEDSVQDVNKQLFNHSKENSQCDGMSTTLVVAICNEQFVSLAHVGDSRIYMKSNEAFSQMTKDHSLVGELVRSGQITREEAVNHPRRNVVLRALGTTESIKVDIDTIDWDSGSNLLLCSDGLTDMLRDQDIEQELTEDKALEEIADRLIQLANERGGEDNITLAIVRHTGQEKGVTDK